MRLPDNSNPIRDDELEALICSCLDLLLPSLPPEQADVVRAIDVEGVPPQSVADSLGLRLDEVTTYLALGREGLKNRFGEMCMICPLHGLAGCDCHLQGNAGA